MLDDRTIRYVAAVDRHGSIRAAARELGLAPSAVQRTIVAAERLVGLELFERGVRGAVATEAGRIVAGQARDRQDLDTQLTSRLDELKGLHRGQVTIAAGEGFVSELWRLALDPFLAEHPGTRVDLRTGGTDHIMSLVAADEADLAIALHPRPDPALRVVRSKDEPLRVVCRPDHPFAGRDRIAPADLGGCSFAVMPRRFGLRTLHDQLLRFHELEVDTRLESESYTALIQAVLSGRAVGLLPTVAIGRYIATGELVAVPLDDPTVSRVQAKLVVRRGRRLLPAARTLVSRCADAMFPESRPADPSAGP